MIRLPQEPRLIGPALRNIRLMVGLRQQDLVDAGVGNQGVISDIENARTVPLIGTILTYLAACGFELGAAPLSETEGS